MTSSHGNDEGTGVDWLSSFVSWFEAHGGSLAKLRVEDLGGDMGLGLVTKEAVSTGQPVMSVPRSICMTTGSVSS